MLVPSVLLALLGCPEGSYYPRPLGPVALDTGVPATLPQIPCNRADEGTVALLTVANPTYDTYQLWRVEDDCVERFAVTVSPQQAWDTTVGNHVVWVVRDASGRFVRWFSLPSGSSVQWVETLP